LSLLQGPLLESSFLSLLFEPSVFLSNPLDRASRGGSPGPHLDSMGFCSGGSFSRRSSSPTGLFALFPLRFSGRGCLHFLGLLPLSPFPHFPRAACGNTSPNLAAPGCFERQFLPLWLDFPPSFIALVFPLFFPPDFHVLRWRSNTIIAATVFSSVSQEPFYPISPSGVLPTVFFFLSLQNWIGLLLGSSLLT